MKTIGILAMLLTLSGATVALAGKEEVIFENNEYGGVTRQIIYSENDANFQQGMRKIVASYDNQGNKRKMEVYATRDHSKKTGWYKKVIYYWDRTKVSEAYSTDSDSAKYGFYKMASYLDGDNRLEKREYFLNQESLAAKLGVYKRVVYYDDKEKITKVEDLDIQGNIVSIE